MNKYRKLSIVEFPKRILLKRICIELLTFLFFLIPAFFTRWLIDQRLELGLGIPLGFIIPVVFFALALHGFSFYWEKYQGQVFTNNLLMDYFQNLASKIASASIPAYEKESKSKILNILNMDISSIYVLSSYLIGMPVNLIKVLVVFGLLFWANPYLALISLVLAPFYLLSTYLNKDKLSKLVAEERLAADATIQDAQVIIDDKKSLDLYGAFDYMLARFSCKVAGWIQARNHQHFYLLLTKEFPNFITTLVPLLFLIIGGNSVVKGQMSLGTLLLALQLTGHIFAPLAEMASLKADLQSQMPVFQRARDFMALPDKEEGLFAENSLDRSLLLKDAFVLGGKGEVLFSIDKLHLPGPGLYLLKGENGTGKSSLFNLLSGVFGQENIRPGKNFCYQLAGEYTDTMLYMCFPNFIFPGSVKENICFGREIEANRLEEMASLLHLPDVDKEVTTKPENLSMGEKQKIYLARTLLSNSNFILLDEPSSNLDSETEARLVKLLDRMREDSLIFIISHNKNFDEIADGQYIIRNKTLVEL